MQASNLETDFQINRDLSAKVKPIFKGKSSPGLKEQMLDN